MAFLYPWGNTQQLNLDWILQKIKELDAGAGNVDLDEVANALISATYRAQSYDRSDIVFHDGKLYRANQAIPAPGEAWTPAHWDEILLGDTVSNLVQYVAALSNDQIVNNSDVSGAHTSDALNNLNDTFGKYEINLNSTYTTNAQNYPTWEQGTIDMSGANSASTTRIRTKFIDIPYESKVHIEAAANYKMSVRVYKGTDTANDNGADNRPSRNALTI